MRRHSSLPSDPSAAASTCREIPPAESRSQARLRRREPDRQQAGEQLRQQATSPPSTSAGGAAEAAPAAETRKVRANEIMAGGAPPRTGEEGGKEGGGKNVTPAEGKRGPKTVEKPSGRWRTPGGAGCGGIPTPPPDRARATARIATDETRD